MITKYDPEQQRADIEHYGRLYGAVKGKIIHCTRWRALTSIMRAGAIEPNRGQFRFSFGQTIHSYGWRMGYISVFDFVSASDEDSIAHAWKWSSLFYRPSHMMFALQIDAEWAAQRLVSARDANASSSDVLFPYVEAWIGEAISFQRVCGMQIFMAGFDPVVVRNAQDAEEVDSCRIDLQKRIRTNNRSPGRRRALLHLRAVSAAARKPR